MNEKSRSMAKIACHALSEKKAEDIRVIDISTVSVIADYFVIASAGNINRLQAMMDAVEEELYKNGYKNGKIEGNRSSSWILMDYQDIIVHLFSREDRLFYDLERIWQDGKTISPEELG
ncbi:MAG: ribosome silencing factor [Clostridiales bacterium]|nr:ribosome silencing factor [Clostridiales bacterium]